MWEMFPPNPYQNVLDSLQSLYSTIEDRRILARLSFTNKEIKILPAERIGPSICQGIVGLLGLPHP